MNIPSQTIIDVLTFLLPGFVSAALLHSLTPTPHPIPFERVVQALIFTIVIQAGTSGVATGLIGIGSRFGSIGLWSEQTRIVWSLVLAGLLGVVLAWIQNTDQLHSRLRKLRIAGGGTGLHDRATYQAEPGRPRLRAWVARNSGPLVPARLPIVP